MAVAPVSTVPSAAAPAPYAERRAELMRRIGPDAALVLDAAGYDVVLVETVGSGQNEVEVQALTETVLLVLMPGSGDSIQALKAGVMEIPDIIVVNKADHPLTDTMVREVKGVLALAPREDGDWDIPVIRAEAARAKRKWTSHGSRGFAR